MKETPYLVEKKGRWFFELGKKRAIRAGWFHEGGPRAGQPISSIPLGKAETREEIARVRKAAQEHYGQYLVDSGSAPPVNSALIGGYPADSLGAWFHVWRSGKFEDWNAKAPRTREDYDRAWTPHIGPSLGHRPIHKIEPNEFARVQRGWGESLSPSERFRVVKCARAIFQAAVRHKLITSSPATILPNSMPQGRNAFFLAAEINTLSASAFQAKKVGMSLAIRTAFETALSPVDVRTLCLALIREDGAGPYIYRERTKTEAEVFAAISAPLWADIQAYIANLADKLKINLTPNAPIFRKLHGQPYRDHKEFGLDFSRVRSLALPGDKRQFQDIRRSANLEMRLGEATPDERAALLANSLNDNRFLEATYTPPTVALARMIVEKRVAGRALLGDKVGTRRSGQLESVGTEK